MSYNNNGATIHTIRGEIFNNAKHFPKGIESLMFTDETVDVHEALISAANYPFRAGVSKTIVLVQCFTCTQPTFAMSSHIKHLLKTRDITLHVLRDHNLQVDDNLSTPTFVSGIKIVTAPMYHLYYSNSHTLVYYIILS